MRVTLKLFALLGRFLPPGAVANAATLEAEDGETVLSLVARVGLSERDCHLVLINGSFVAVSERSSRILAPDDVVSIWPPIGGG